MVSRNPSSWSSQLVWVEHPYNSLLSSVTRLSPFQCVYGYQLHLFSAPSMDVSCPSAAAYVRRPDLGPGPDHPPAIHGLLRSCSQPTSDSRPSRYRVGQKVRYNQSYGRTPVRTLKRLRTKSVRSSPARLPSWH